MKSFFIFVSVNIRKKLESFSFKRVLKATRLSAVGAISNKHTESFLTQRQRKQT